MIDKLQQLERVKIFDLLHQPDVWQSLNIDYHPPHVERLWCQLGVYRLYLHFIHPCGEGESFFHPHPWPCAIHVLEGSYETGFGYGEGTEEPEILSKIIVPNGGMYYDMTSKNAWHYVRPIGGVCSSVMLAGQLWDREMPEVDKGELGSLHNDRVVVMLEYFKNHYRTLIRRDNDRLMSQTLERGNWVMIDERLMNQYDKKQFNQFIGQQAFVIKNDSIDGLCVRFGNERVDDVPHGIMKKLPKPVGP